MNMYCGACVFMLLAMIFFLEISDDVSLITRVE
jgi:hypothetical protein